MENAYKIALLIDAENVPVNRIPSVIKEMAKFGTPITSRFYADIKAIGDDWKRVSGDYAIRPIHQYNVAAKKNAADMAMSLDALDIMNQGLVNMFILVTSDSDFTPLVIKLRERGAVVIGIGDNKASKAFVSSCNEFKYFDYLVDGEKSEEVSTTELTATIKNLVIENGVEGKIQLSMLGNQLINLQSDFDPRRYGAKSLSKLISALKAFKIVNENDKLYVVVAESLNTNEINTFIKNKIEASKNKKISLPEMKKMLEVAYPGFNSESYGFSRFGKFIDSFDDLELDGNYAIISK